MIVSVLCGNSAIIPLRFATDFSDGEELEISFATWRKIYPAQSEINIQLTADETRNIACGTYILFATKIGADGSRERISDNTIKVKFTLCPAEAGIGGEITVGSKGGWESVTFAPASGSYEDWQLTAEAGKAYYCLGEADSGTPFFVHVDNLKSGDRFAIISTGTVSNIGSIIFARNGYPIFGGWKDGMGMLDLIDPFMNTYSSFAIICEIINDSDAVLSGGSPFVIANPF